MTTRRQLLAAASAIAGAAVALTIPVAAKAAESVTPIQAAFVRWVEQQNEIRRISGTATDEEMEIACNRGFDIAQDVMNLPAGSVSDMALKTYVLMHCNYGETSSGDIFDVALSEDSSVFRDMERALYADVFRFVEPFIGGAA